MKKELIERVLQRELEHELGYDKHSKKGSNRRNGSYNKTIIDKQGNKMPIEVPRDREGEYDPQFVQRGIRRFKGFDDQVISLYGKGMTVGEIQEHIKDIYTTNIIEVANRQIRKIIKNNGVFPNDKSIQKIVYLALKNASKKCTMPIKNWPLVLNQFEILCGDSQYDLAYKIRK